MSLIEVTSPANPMVKRLKSLADKKARREEGLFLAEGLRVCTEALEAGQLPAVLAITTEAAAHPLGAKLLAAVLAARRPAMQVPREIIGRITGKDNAQGVAAAYPLPETGLDRLETGTAPLWLVAESIRDPGNIGTMLRSCDGTGAGGLILLDSCADPWSLEAVRASMGAIFSRQIALASGPAFFAWRRARPGQLVGAALGPGSTDYRHHQWQRPAYLMVGGEQAGLPPAYASECDALVRLPMKGTADSLNVAVAAGVLLYHALGQFEPLQADR